MARGPAIVGPEHRVRLRVGIGVGLCTRIRAQVAVTQMWPVF